MLKPFTLFLKFQSLYLIFLFGIFVLPLGLFFQFSPYQLPKVQYVVLGALILSQYYFFKEKSYRKKIEEKVTKSLQKDLGKVPSRKQIIECSTSVIQYRGITIALSALSILILMVSYNEF